MRRSHHMPFGAELVDDGVRFRLWAPAATHVELCRGERRQPMTAAGSGWFELRADDAAPGTRYGFVIDGAGPLVPDPASRSNPDDVHAASAVVDPGAFDWQDDGWRGRPWNEAVVYELHVGSFSPAGTFDGVVERLPYLADLGVTAIELMPVADFPGDRGWGYDGVLPFAPEAAYGTPAAMKRLVEAAHGHGLMVLLDVVYNHFGPDGNYLHLYAPQFFTDRVQTPWGKAIDFEGEASATVRDFFIHNALYWLTEYHLDGLRLDAVHAIHDRSDPDVLAELADRVRAHVPADRHVHLVLENDDNAAHYLRSTDASRPRFDAQWNDDYHHVMHVLLSGEAHGYYVDYAEDPMEQLGRCLAEGFVYQGEVSPYRGRPRGERSAGLPSSAFVNFLQNHDQVGNRAFGERLGALAAPEALEAARAMLLLAPQPPMLFMGEEFASSRPFPYFCSYDEELGRAVAEGRRQEFSRFPEFADPAARERIPDPNDPTTFRRARLDWDESRRSPHREALEHCRRLLALRREHLTPRLPAADGRARRLGGRLLAVDWRLAGGERWSLVASLGGEAVTVDAPPGRLVYASESAALSTTSLTMSPWSVVVALSA